MNTPRDNTLLLRYAESADIPALRRLAQQNALDRPPAKRPESLTPSRAHAREASR
jgi:hypothetical protein